MSRCLVVFSISLHQLHTWAVRDGLGHIFLGDLGQKLGCLRIGFFLALGIPRWWLRTKGFQHISGRFIGLASYFRRSEPLGW
jgi:hypothetical protein